MQEWWEMLEFVASACDAPSAIRPFAASATNDSSLITHNYCSSSNQGQRVSETLTNTVYNACPEYRAFRSVQLVSDEAARSFKVT